MCISSSSKEGMYSATAALNNENASRENLFWFSHKEKKYEVQSISFDKLFRWKHEEEPIMWDWDNCRIGIAKQLDEEGKIRLVIRSQTNRNSTYMGSKPVQLRYMMGIDVSKDGLLEPPWEQENYQVTSEREHLHKLGIKPRDRWVFNLDKQYWIWEWARKDRAIQSSKTYSLYQTLKERFDSPSQLPHDNIFRSEVKSSNTASIIPVIYQPAVDSLKNFLREVYCVETKNSDGSCDVEVSLLFNNEELRKFALGGFLDYAYKEFRRQKYGRIFDIESFKIHLSKEAMADIESCRSNGTMKEQEEKGSDSSSNNDYSHNDEGSYFIFQGIYSDKHDLKYDTIHGDKEITYRPIKYYFNSKKHPIVFINTSNHAMAEYDNNHQIWKWEYVPWVRKAPIKFGTRSREELDSEYNRLL
jgi:hypothetical protein